MTISDMGGNAVLLDRAGNRTRMDADRRKTSEDVGREYMDTPIIDKYEHHEEAGVGGPSIPRVIFCARGKHCTVSAFTTKPISVHVAK